VLLTRVSSYSLIPAGFVFLGIISVLCSNFVDQEEERPNKESKRCSPSTPYSSLDLSPTRFGPVSLLRCPSRPCSSPPAEDHHEDLCAPISPLSELHRRGAPDLTSTPLPLASCSVPPLSEAGSAGVEPARTSRSTWLSGPPRRAHSLTASPLLPPGRTPVLHREGGGGHAVRLHRGGLWRFIFLASLGLGDPS
jgi:hypothetical protein